MLSGIWVEVASLLATVHRGRGGDVAGASRRGQDGGWAHSAAIARQVQPAPRRLAT